MADAAVVPAFGGGPGTVRYRTRYGHCFAATDVGTVAADADA